MDPEIIQQLLAHHSTDEVILVENGLELHTQKKIIWKLKDFACGMADSFQIELERDGEVRSSVWVFCLHSSGGNPLLKYGRQNDQNYDFNEAESRLYHYVEASILEPNGMKMGKTYKSDLLSFTYFDADTQIFHLDKKSLHLPFDSSGHRYFVLELTLKLFKTTPQVKTKLDGKGNEAFLDSAMVNVKPKPKTNFRAFLNSKNHSDVKIFSKDGQEFHAHKVILRAGSEVFDSMLKTEMTESITGIIKLDDMSAAAVTFLLNYLYCGEILPFSVNGKKLGDEVEATSKETFVAVTAEEALYVASKYRLDELRDYMDHSFRRFCNEENAIDLLGMSKLYSLNCKEFLKNFIKNHPRALDKILELQF